MSIVESLEAYSAWQRYAFFAAIIVFLCLGFYYFRVKPDTLQIAQYDHKIQELDAKINKGLAMKDKLEEFRKEVFQLKERMRLAAEVLGNRPNVDILVKAMENLASQCGLQVERFQPLPERKKGFYGEIPINLSLFGRFHELGYFFDKVSNETRIMNVSDLQITAIQGRHGDATISATCVLTAFWYLAR